MTAPLVVTAAVVEQHDCFLLTRRLRGTHLEGQWEFPGGKCDPGESLVEGLVREIDEELGCAVTVGREIYTITHAYQERTVELHFFACTLAGEPRPHLGQEMRWVARDALRSLTFPAADRELIELLSDPPGSPDVRRPNARAEREEDGGR
jgi:8-oxo-dGTP diphosphatase